MAGAAWFIGHMTKAEAVKKITVSWQQERASYVTPLWQEAEKVLRALEAIGLVKFDEPERAFTTEEMLDRPGTDMTRILHGVKTTYGTGATATVSVDRDSAIAALEKAGYLVINGKSGKQSAVSAFIQALGTM